MMRAPPQRHPDVLVVGAEQLGGDFIFLSFSVRLSFQSAKIARPRRRLQANRSYGAWDGTTLGANHRPGIGSSEADRLSQRGKFGERVVMASNSYAARALTC